MAETYDALMKIVIIGDTSVGKTCLILRYTHDTFRENFLSTIGVDFKTKKVVQDGKCYKLQIWDTAGQERYNTIRKNFYRGAKGVVIVYDIASIDSFLSITRWMEDIMTNIDGDLPSNRPAVLILANKCDLEDERKIETERGEEMAKEFKAQFAEVSARTGAGVDKAFDGLVVEMSALMDQQLEEQRNSYMPSIKLGGDSVDYGREPSSCSC